MRKTANGKIATYRGVGIETMNRVFRMMVAVTLIPLMSGCAALMSRTHYTNGTRMLQEPPYYSGAAMDLMAIGESVSAPFDGDPKSEGWLFWTFPFYLIDLPFSTIVDTFYIPSDYKLNQREGWKRNANKLRISPDCEAVGD